jgi:predicted ATP-grasp superfamily ATP-dependent carboligase
MGMVLVLDGNQRSALAVVRSLGKRNIPVIVGDESAPTLAGCSKYCRETMVYPSPYSQPVEFVQAVKTQSVRRAVEVLFPMSDVTTPLLLQYQDEFAAAGIKIASASFRAFETLTDKRKLCGLAQELDIPIPVTRAVASPEALRSALRELRLPVVLKPYRSRIFTGSQWITASVAYADSVESLERTMAENESFRNHPFLLQEYIKGEGRGIFALYDHGRCVALFAHRRLREKPPSGGVSVLSESVKVDPDMGKLSRRLLDHVGWHGVAMVEFKISPEGAPYLMEVNARFWGSLQLAIDAGVDFPWLLYQMATNVPLDRIDEYRVGLKNRWLLGDLDHLYLALKNTTPAAQKCRAILSFLNFFNRDTKHEIDRWSDLRPFLFELKQYVAGMRQ